MAADYIIQNSNNYEKKSFLSSDANILVDGTKEIRIGALARYALSNWSISFSVTKLSASGNTYFTQSGGITIDDTVLSSLETGIGKHIIVTSGGTVYYDGYPLTTGAGLGNLLNAQITIGTGNFVISNICLFDTVVNDIQATQQDDYKGTVPKSLRANCIGFWTCQQQYSREIVTGDEALNKGLSLGNLALWDSCEMFNPDKGSALVANHGNLFNYNTTNTGASNSSSQKVIKDFYGDNSNEWKYGYIDFNDLAQEVTFSSNTNWASLEYEGTANLSLNIAGSKIDVNGIGSAWNIQIKDGGGTVLTRLNPNLAGDTTIIDTVGTNDGTLVGFTTNETKTGGGAYKEIKTDLPPLRECLHILGQQYIEYDTGSLPDGAEDYIFFSTSIKDNTNINGVINPFANVENHYSIIDSSTGTGTVSCTSIRCPFFQTRINGVDYFRFNVNADIVPPVTTDYTFINTTGGQTKYIINAVSIRRNGVVKIYVNGMQTTPIVSGNGASTINPSNFISAVFRTGYTGYVASNENVNSDFKIISCGLWKGNSLDNWNIHELYRNSIVGNPFAWFTSQNTGFQDGLVNYHQFQEGSIYWDNINSVYKVKNWGSGADATLGGYVTTGGNPFTTNNPNSIVDIDSLR